MQGLKGRRKVPPEKPLESTGATSATIRAADRAWRGQRGQRAQGAEALPAGAGSSGVRRQRAVGDACSSKDTGLLDGSESREELQNGP